MTKHTPDFVYIYVSETMNNEYTTRGVFCGDEFPDGPGRLQIKLPVVFAMRRDAAYFVDPDGPDELPYSIKRAYAALIVQIDAALERHMRAHLARAALAKVEG